jgi:hypothetical protein
VKFEDNLTKKWDMMLMDHHYIGALLNLCLKDILEIHENSDAKCALNRVVHNLSAVLGVQFNDAMAELTDYEEHRGPYSLLKALDINTKLAIFALRQVHCSTAILVPKLGVKAHYTPCTFRHKKSTKKY